MRARWRPESAVSASSALTVYSVTGDVNDALSALGIPPVAVGGKGLREIAGVDQALVARPSETCVWIVTHGGRGVAESVRKAFDSAGIRGGAASDEADVRARFPEAVDEIEARVLDTLPRAAGTLAVERLLGEPRRWRDAGLLHAGNIRGEMAISARWQDGAFAPRVLSRLIETPTVVLVGAANIGKSTLVNTMARRAVSIVAPTPGTTRDHVGVDVDFGGLVARVIDTPGVREIADEGDGAAVERAASGLALGVAARADLLLMCRDPMTEPIDLPDFEPGLAARQIPALHICLRCDLGEPTQVCHGAVITSAHRVSAHTGAGLEGLYSAIRESLVPEAALRDQRSWRFWESRASTVIA